ncbi:MAG: hypothetical protein IGNPGNKH_00634 [Sodalis sp. Ffu]|nr:MAG: hypothetical protein IGNPGNKH_00634 [Sodalis sp. Ffu]
MLLSGLMKNFALMELAMLNKYSCRQFFPSLNIVQPLSIDRNTYSTFLLSVFIIEH